MKRYIKSSESRAKLPQPFNRYYDIISEDELNELIGYDSDEDEDEGYLCETIPGYDMKHIAYVYAKPKYREKLSDDGMEFLELMQEGDREPFLGYIIHDRIYRFDKGDLDRTLGR